MGQQRPHNEPKVFHRAPRLDPTESYGDEQSSFCLIFCEFLFCFILTFSFITFQFSLEIKDLGHFPTEKGMGRKKTYGIFNKGAQEGEKSSKNKAETVLVDTLYNIQYIIYNI